MNRFVFHTVAALSFALLAACSHWTWSWNPGEALVSLSGTDEVPPVRTDASGSGIFRLADDGTLTGSVTTKDVQGTMAHIHAGSNRENGPVVVALEKKGNTYRVPEGARLTPEQVKAFKDGRLYVNVHSEQYKTGEIRGRLQP